MLVVDRGPLCTIVVPTVPMPRGLLSAVCYLLSPHWHLKGNFEIDYFCGIYHYPMAREPCFCWVYTCWLIYNILILHKKRVKCMRRIAIIYSHNMRNMTFPMEWKFPSPPYRSLTLNLNPRSYCALA